MNKLEELTANAVLQEVVQQRDGALARCTQLAAEIAKLKHKVAELTPQEEEKK